MNMPMEFYLEKAEESVAGAESEFANGRYNNCANRCYYACFQAAIQALIRINIQPSGGRGWGHEFVQAEFVRQLIHRRKLYPAALRETLARNLILRHTADYAPDQVTEIQAARAIHRTRELMDAIRERGGEKS